jgi:HK97 family phage major capsid protein
MKSDNFDEIAPGYFRARGYTPGKPAPARNSPRAVSKPPAPALKVSAAKSEVKDHVDALRSVADGLVALRRETQRARTNPRKFRSLAENLAATVKYERGEGMDARLVRANAANESDAAAGGFLIAPEFAAGLVDSMYGTQGSIIGALCTRLPTTMNLADVKIPGVDESSRADGSRYGGIVSYWARESDSVAVSFPKFRRLEFGARKLIAVCYGTSELVNDSTLFQAYIQRAFSAELGCRMDEAILSGDGAGHPLGILNSGALITVAKESMQAAATIVNANVAKMWSSLPIPSRRNAVWLVNEGAEAQLDELSSGGGANAFTFIPAGVFGSPYPALRGRPVVAVESCPALGNVGDIILADLNQYLLLDGGVQPALSAEVEFLTDQVVFRFVLRCDGQSAYSSPVTSVDGTSRSPFVTLAARS